MSQEGNKKEKDQSKEDKGKKSSSSSGNNHGDGGNGHHHHDHPGHVHGGACGCEHNHDDDMPGATEHTLYPYIDQTKLRCENEHKVGAGKSVFKPWDERLDTSKFVTSGVDEELLFQIPFTVACKVKSIAVIGGDESSAPAKMKVFKNKDNIDMSNADNAKAEQEFSMAYDSNGSGEYFLKAFKFQNVSTLTLFFPKSLNDDYTQINYIGIKGESTKFKRQIVETVYEAKPNAQDHEVKEESFFSKQVQ